MTLYEFNALDEMEQAEALWDGVLVADSEDPSRFYCILFLMRWVVHQLKLNLLLN